MKSYITWLLLIPIFGYSQPTQEQIKQVEEAKKEVLQMKGKPFPAFSLTTLDGKMLSNESLKGRPYLLNFWFTRCGPCIKEIPELNNLVATYGENIQFIAPTFDDRLTVQGFLNRFDFSYLIVPDEKKFCIDSNVRSFPTHFVVDQDGIVQKIITGYGQGTIQSLRKSIDKLLISR